MVHWHKSDLENRMYLNLPNGKKCAMPRYYKQKIYNETEKKIVAFFVGKRVVHDQLADMRKAGLFDENPTKRRLNSEKYYSRKASILKRKELASTVKK